MEMANDKQNNNYNLDIYEKIIKHISKYRD